MSRSLPPMFYSRNFMVLGPIFKSLSHFELIFACSIRQCSSFILLHVAVQFSKHHLLKRLFFPYCVFLPPLSKIKVPIGVWVYFWANILSHWFIFLFLFQYRTVLMTISFVVWSEVRTVEFSSSVFLSQDCFVYSGNLCFHTNYEIFLFWFYGCTIGSLIEITLNLQMALGSMVAFKIPILLI